MTTHTPRRCTADYFEHPDDDPWHCTLPEGHPGPHQAWGALGPDDHLWNEWPNTTR